jgi:hypothetical protein
VSYLQYLLTTVNHLVEFMDAILVTLSLPLYCQQVAAALAECVADVGYLPASQGMECFGVWFFAVWASDVLRYDAIGAVSIVVIGALSVILDVEQVVILPAIEAEIDCLASVGSLEEVADVGILKHV